MIINNTSYMSLTRGGESKINIQVHVYFSGYRVVTNVCDARGKLHSFG
jgi:hypothetical protein